MIHDGSLSCMANCVISLQIFYMYWQCTVGLWWSLHWPIPRPHSYTSYLHIREFVHDAILQLGWHTRDANSVPQQRQWIHLQYYRRGHMELHLLVWQMVWLISYSIICLQSARVLNCYPMPMCDESQILHLQNKSVARVQNVFHLNE